MHPSSSTQAIYFWGRFWGRIAPECAHGKRFTFSTPLQYGSHRLRRFELKNIDGIFDGTEA
jgi:hypothetical protein